MTGWAGKIREMEQSDAHQADLDGNFRFRWPEGTRVVMEVIGIGADAQAKHHHWRATTPRRDVLPERCKVGGLPDPPLKRLRERAAIWLAPWLG